MSQEDQSRFGVSQEELGSQLDDFAYSTFGPLTEYIIDSTDYREYTSRMTKPSRYYISRIFLDTLIALIVSTIIFVIITILFLGGFTSVFAPLMTIFLELLSVIPWIIAISYDSLNAVFTPIVNLIGTLLTSSGVSTIVETLTGLPVIGVVFSFLFGIVFVISQFLVIIADQVSPSGLESPEPNFNSNFDLSSSLVSIEIFALLSLLSIFLVSIAVFIYRVYYPIYYNNELDRAVETNRAESYLFLYAMTKGGLGAGRAMSELGTAEETYGMTADIFNSIVQRAKFSSMNLRDSIVVEARSSENEELSDFLYGIVNTMDTGSNVSEYLENKSKDALEEKRKDQESFFDILDIISETYVILVVVFPIFVLVIQLVSGIIGSLFNQFLLQLIPYMFIPAGGFVITIIVYVFGDSKSTFREISKPKAPYELRFKDEKKSQDQSILNNYSFNIFEKMLYKPIYTTLVTVPLIVIYMAVIIQVGVVPLSPEGWDQEPMVPTFYAYYIPLIILFLPWSIAYEREKYRRSRLESQLLSLLETVRASNERGLTLEESLATAADVEDEGLYDELAKAINKSSVTNQLDRSLVEFANEVRVPRISEAMYLITRANQVSGNISSVLETVTNDFNELYRIKRDRSRRAKEYASTILVALLVGIVLILSLDVLFFDFILEQTPSGEGEESAASQAGVELFGNIPQGVFRRLFLHTVMSTSLTSGLVIGVMDNGRPENGLKYMIAFSTMGILAFILRLSLI